ncbi:MAG: 4Fe-4S binding protein [Erysipelotrichaceae bacterium]|nr:4Fe-4S binding protein [Erysipelotrichaceae bacterium]
MVPYTTKNSLEVDGSCCIGCGLCKVVCPHRVFDLQSKKVKIKNAEACIECGACATNCPVTAISVQASVGCASAIFASEGL